MGKLVGTSAVLAPALHSLTDVLEALGGGFSVPQLGLNYVAFVAMPFIVLGLYAMQRPRMGWLGLAGALAYGAAFVYFAGTAAYALARGTPDYATLLRELGGLTSRTEYSWLRVGSSSARRSFAPGSSRLGRGSR